MPPLRFYGEGWHHYLSAVDEVALTLEIKLKKSQLIDILEEIGP